MLADPQEKALDRPGMTRRLHVPIMVVVAMLAISCSPDLGDGPGASRPVHEAATPETSSRHPPPSPRPNNVVVTITESDCTLDTAERSISPPRLKFVALNQTDDLVAFDIGMLVDGHTFDELTDDVEDSIRGQHPGGPVAQRPRYFRASFVGDISSGRGAQPGPSLLQVGRMWGGTLTWSYHPGGYSPYDLADPRGTWAVICYRSPAHGGGLEQIGVVGPVEVGSASLSATVHRDYFVDLRTNETTPLPESITSIPGAGNYLASPDGSSLLFDSSGDQSTVSQVHVARVGGKRTHQLTNDPEGALEGSWSPDGTTVVYVGRWSRSGDLDEHAALFLVDVTTGKTTRLVGGRAGNLIDPHFSLNGGSIQFSRRGDLWSIPVTGGTPRLEVGLEGAGQARYSPDGTMIAFGKTGYWRFGHGGGSFGEIWLSSPDSSNRHHLAGDKDNSLAEWVWSPDGTRLAALDVQADDVVIVDVSTKQLTRLGVRGWPASWFDDDTLIIDIQER